jgi:branched-chain amino acid transport system substrate-binding protein
MLRHAFLLILILPSLSFGKTLRIAALYSTTNQGQNNFGYGLEAACMTRAVVEDAQERGLQVTLESFDLGPSAVSTSLTAQRIANGNFDVALGTLTSMEAIAASRVFELAKLPFIVPTATNPEVTEGKKYVARIPFTDSRQAELLSKFTVRELRPKVVAIIRNASNPYSDYLGKEYKKDLEAMSPEVKVHDFPIIDGLDDRGNLVPSLLAVKPDVIFVPVLQATVAYLYAEFTRLKVKTTLLGSDIVESDVNFMQVLGRTNPSIRFVFVQHWDRKYEGAIGKTYQRLQNKYCSQYRPSMVTAAVFDATTLLIETAKKYPNASKCSAPMKIGHRRQ